MSVSSVSPEQRMVFMRSHWAGDSVVSAAQSAKEVGLQYVVNKHKDAHVEMHTRGAMRSVHSEHENCKYNAYVVYMSFKIIAFYCLS